MEGSSKVLVGGVVIMVVTLAILLALVLVLVAELYCSLFLRRSRRRSPLTKNDASGSRSLSQLLQEDSRTSSLGSFYEQGVLRAPRSFLFPSFHGKDKMVNLELPPITPPKLVSVSIDSGEVCGCSNSDNYIYICNPIYDIRVGVEATPFGTPDSSPSRLEEVVSSEEEEEGGDVVELALAVLYSCPDDERGPHIMTTPPLTPMKNLPAEAASVSLREVGSLATTGSGSISSSQSSTSPCNSLSW